MEFLPRTLFYYILCHGYLFWCFYRLFGKKRLFCITAPFFVCMGLFPFLYQLLAGGTAQLVFGKIGIVWLPPAFFLLVVFLAADVLSLLALLLRKKFPSIVMLFFSRRRYLLLLVLLAAGVYGYGIFEAHNLQVTRLDLRTAKLLDGVERLRIAFVSDVHIGPQTGTGMLKTTVDAILEQKPDVILLGGDIFDDSLQGTPQDVEQLRRLHAPLGVYAVLGNHDTFGDHRYAVETLQRTGIRLLSDETAVAGPLLIAGQDDPLVSEQKGIAGARVKELLAHAPQGSFTVLLAHRPVIEQDAVGLYDVQLSGHSHGGQILPLKPVLESEYGTPTGYSEHEGVFGKSCLFVTTGTGFSKLPIRLLVPPEVVVIDVAR